ncbi:unnamed protein product [Adineta steineri]|uniref:Uncharacterized protein n=4 Tax=Adineta steineri TaxID=433720 RepID=A0A818ILW0_9BILA|nr:unnamed protein product [Adineta steineri]CAF3526576.1 unnamed protein product [Adineta steineri]
MAHSELTQKDRAFAASAGVSATPATTPPQTPRHGSTADIESTTKFELPRSAYYIIFVEGCERFCFYGLKTVLLLYFMHFLSLNKDTSTAGYHLFSSACYLTPIIGAIISDGFIGRYSTILYLSFVYLLGTVVLTLTAIPQIGGRNLTGPIIGLSLIALGTGGIKPCVSAFGADQISMANPKQLSRFFAFFYFAINFGSLISTLLTPILRSKVSCFGYDCYSLAFGIPAILMLISIIIFIIGTPLYKRIPPKENIIVKFIAIILRAIRNTFSGSSSGRREHWLYRADDKYSADDIEDVRSVLRVCLLFTPIPVFYALFDQSGSRWTYQATLMNGSLGPFGTIQPDQMQALNSLFVLLFIPLFEEVIYPAFARCNLLIRPLQRMFCGLIIMMFAFIVAAMLQQAIDLKSNAMPVRRHTNIYNGYNCTITMNTTLKIDPREVAPISCTRLLQEGLVLTSTCNGAFVHFQLATDEICPSILIISELNDESRGQMMGVTSLSNSLSNQRGVKEFALLRMVSLDGKQTKIQTIPNKYQYDIEKKLLPTAYQSVFPTDYRIEDLVSGKQSVKLFDVHTTAVYTALLYTTDDNKLHTVLFEDVPPFTVHILWQTVQYALMTSAEMLVSITGLVFAYSQAPKRYKSVIMSAWLLTSAIGDLIVVFVAEARMIKDQALEFVFFAILMAFATFIFGFLAIHYKDRKPRADEADEDQQLILDKNTSEPDQLIQ